VLTTIVTHAVELAGMDGGTIEEYDEQRNAFLVRATHGMDEELVAGLRANPIRLGEGAVGKAAVTREPIAFPDIAEGGYEPRLRTFSRRPDFAPS
jgi:hypothetical protein